VATEAAPTPEPHSTADLEALRPGLRLIALRALGSADVADEVVQESLARAVVALGKGQPSDPAKIPAFVAGIARHVIVDFQRAQRRMVSLDSDSQVLLPAMEASALDALVQAGDRLTIRTALAQLPSTDRELLRLCYFEGLTPAEVAKRLGEPSDRIRKRKSRALERLRNTLTGRHERIGSSDRTSEEPRS